MIVAGCIETTMLQVIFVSIKLLVSIWLTGTAYSTSEFLSSPPPSGIERVFQQRPHQVITILRAGAHLAGAEFNFLDQGFQCGFESFVRIGLTRQEGFGFAGPERDRAARSYCNTNQFDRIAFTLQPDGVVDDRQGHTLRAHDALEAGALPWFDLIDIEADNDLTALQGGFAGAEEQLG